MDEMNEIESWQQAEDARLEYEGYCNKIRQGLEELSGKSGERALWELVQNARDLSDAARLRIELTDGSLIFSHHGKPFDYTSLRALVKQDSSKDRTGADLVGQYGTGFMTTHTFNRLVYVSGPFVVKSGKDEVRGYVQIRDFELDRRYVDTSEGPSKMKEQLDTVRQLWKGSLSDEILDDTTSFRYDLSPEKVAEVSEQLSAAVRMMPFVLVINDRVREVEIFNHATGSHFMIRKTGVLSARPLEKTEWKELTEEISITNLKGNCEPDTYVCKSLRSNKGDVVIIPPFPEQCGDVDEIPSLFLWFPLLGTEAFGVNFIFHSRRFYPVEKRNNIMLPGSSEMSREKGGANSEVLKEMAEVLFDYYANEENASALTRQMCEVAFPTLCEDEETRKFYEEMQRIWKARIPDWKILTAAGERHAVSEPEVRLLHRDFYLCLTSEKRVKYEPVLAAYARLPQKPGGGPFVMPDADLIVWSETVDRWDCGRDREFFITVEDICKAIQSKRDDLLSFLKLLTDSQNEKVLERYPLLPNREGELHTKGNLCHAAFMDSDSAVYELVKIVMGEDVRKILDPAFRDICEVSPYTQSDLQRAITSTMNSWRVASLSGSDKKPLTESQLDALINFCSASCQPEFNNARGRMMPRIADFFGKEFRPITTIRFKEENEEEFYNVAFNLLLDYTLSVLCQKDAGWVRAHKEWLKMFLDNYSPSTNEDHRKRLDDYGVLPNQKNELCLMRDLRLNNGVPDEMALIYKEIFGRDLYESWIGPEFAEIVTLPADEPGEIAATIESALVADMKLEVEERKFQKIVRAIVLKIGKSKDWEEWFGRINDNKAIYTFSMKSGKARESLFSLMDLEDENLDRLARLSEEGDIAELLDEMERRRQLEYENEARFCHLHAIGKYIEDVLREKIGSDLVEVATSDRSDENATADDVQNGQDIIVRIKDGEKKTDVYYIEVKSKWDFSEAAHKSTRQVRMAALQPDKYALCCVDLRKYKSEDLTKLSPETVIGCIRVKMSIGETLGPMMAAILEADKRSDDVQIKISDYRSNMSARIFEQGEPLETLLARIETLLHDRLQTGAVSSRQPTD